MLLPQKLLPGVLSSPSLHLPSTLRGSPGDHMPATYKAPSADPGLLSPACSPVPSLPPHPRLALLDFWSRPGLPSRPRLAVISGLLSLACPPSVPTHPLILSLLRAAFSTTLRFPCFCISLSCPPCNSQTLPQAFTVSGHTAGFCPSSCQISSWVRSAAPLCHTLHL